MRHVRRVQPPMYAEAARLCLEKMVRACDALATSTADQRWQDAAADLHHTVTVLRQLEGAGGPVEERC